VTGTELTRRGRPLGALALAGLALALWLAVRLPEVGRLHAATMAAIAGNLDIGTATTLVTPVLALPLQVVMARLPPLIVAPERSSVRSSSRRPGQAAPASIAQAGHSEKRPQTTEQKLAAPAVPALLAAGGAAPAPATGFDLATSAYARIAAGDRRAADRLFAAALAQDRGAPQAAQWATERRRLNRRWSGDAYVLFRDAGTGSAAATPVLGGGQSGASLSYALDPLAQRPFDIIGRVYAAHDRRGVADVATAQAALGVRWRPLPGVSIAAERLIGIGEATSADWNLRLSAGGQRRIGRIVFDGYAEAGARGNGDTYAGGQIYAALPLGALGPARVTAGPGSWGSAQSGFTTVSRVDIGGGIAARLPSGLEARADWRWRVAGNAQPGSGPAVTISWVF